MRALITGIAGQDGSYLAELLLGKGYEVHGLVRAPLPASRTAAAFANLEQVLPHITLHHGDLRDRASLCDAVRRACPDEIYHLAGDSAVRDSFADPERVADVLALGTLRLLEIARAAQQATGKAIRFYQAGSSEMFGVAQHERHDERAAFRPRTPYGVAKLAAHWHVVRHRGAHGLFAANGILFNHESPRRRPSFVSRKITRAAARIRLGLQDRLHLGNLEARRDWGFAADYVEAMWRMLQRAEPGDYVIASGETHSVRELCELSFAMVGLDWQEYVRVDPQLLRPAETDALAGDASRALRELGWRPRVSFRELLAMMVQSDLELAQRERNGLGGRGEPPEKVSVSCG
ncbi:MAG: GDP-mannose 4,6-dehydratase [Planctomycetota bacterium]